MQEILFQDQMPSMGGIVLRRGFVWSCLAPSLSKLSTSKREYSLQKEKKHFPRYNGESNANQQTVQYNSKTCSDNF